MSEAQHMSEAELRKIFHTFDVDRSGSVASDELAAIIAAAGLAVPPAELQRIIDMADTDGSGEVEFEEFIQCLYHQHDGGGLLSLVAQSSSFFGWMTDWRQWFSAEPAASQLPDKPSPRHQVRRDAAAAPRRSTRHSSLRLPVGVRSQRSVASESLLHHLNAQTAEETRQQQNERHAIRRERQRDFMARQQQRIQLFRQQEVDASEAKQALLASKRAMGSEMRRTVQKQWHAVQAKESTRAAIVSKTALDARAAKQAEVEARKTEQQRSATVIRERAQCERRKRREESLATVRSQTQAAKDFAARVRHETRPAVRQNSAEYFQAQRDTICAEERERQLADRLMRHCQQDAFLSQASERIHKVQVTDMDAMDARRRLAEQRRQEADEVRRQLQAERERKEQAEEVATRELRERHDTVLGQRWNPLLGRPAVTADSEEVAAGSGSENPRLEIRQGLKAKSREWSGR